jgi:hypothetical protein
MNTQDKELNSWERKGFMSFLKVYLSGEGKEEEIQTNIIADQVENLLSTQLNTIREKIEKIDEEKYESFQLKNIILQLLKYMEY